MVFSYVGIINYRLLRSSLVSRFRYSNFWSLAGGPADHGPVLLAENLHLIVFPHADLLQELLGDLDAEAAVGPLDHVEVRHEWSLLICTAAEPR